MIESMTGFATRTCEISFTDAQTEKRIDLLIELKSLNSRYFEASFRVPSSVARFELELNSLLKKQLIRGRVFCSIKSAKSQEILESYQPVHDVIKGYVAFAQESAQRYGLQNDLSVAQVLTAPGAFVPTALEMSEAQEEAFFDAFKNVCNELQVSRRREGHALFLDLQERAKICIHRLGIIEESFASFFEQKKKELAVQKELCSDQEKVMQDPGLKLKLDELFSVVHKGDIHEEIVRFKTHCASFSKLISDSSSEEKGRRLEFILQELNREVNTMMAKSVVAAISSAGIDIKCELDKMREQIQNVV
ncbi:DUF1732 domain-containing protein [Candidatus Dependentiae bacterium]|nr:DUF1732 domain-containing protein [Candidatus Dependentiae bacterium]